MRFTSNEIATLPRKTETSQNWLLIFSGKETHSKKHSWKSSKISSKKVTTTTANLENEDFACEAKFLHFSSCSSLFVIFLHFSLFSPSFFVLHHFRTLFFIFFIFHYVSSSVFFLFFIFSFFHFFFHFFHFFIFHFCVLCSKSDFWRPQFLHDFLRTLPFKIKHSYQGLTKDVSSVLGAPWRCGVLTTGWAACLEREHASTHQSGVEAPRLLKRSLPRLCYCCCWCVVCCGVVVVVVLLLLSCCVVVVLLLVVCCCCCVWLVVGGWWLWVVVVGCRLWVVVVSVWAFNVCMSTSPTYATTVSETN